jgi:hypothetical protein
MAFGFGFGMPRSFAVPPFSPASLFVGGIPGVWYDPSDYGATGTLFQDSAGTTPVTAVEQPVGLMLDKSQGLVLGPELVTNGDFSNGSTGWTLDPGWTISGGAASVNIPGAPRYLRQLGKLTVGKTYLVTYTATVTSGGNFGAGFGWSPQIASPTSGTYTARLTATTTDILFYANSDSIASIDNISVKELPGNHAFQATDTSRPRLSARYNLLTKTEQFDDAVWTKNGATIAANSAVAPDGSTSADTLIEAATTSAHYIDRSVTTSAVPYTFSVYAKAVTRSWIYLRIADSSGIARVVWFNAASGVIGAVGGGITASIEAAGNGWYKCVATISAALAGSQNPRIGVANADNVESYTGDGTSGIYIWGAQLIVANSLTSNTYQRVNTATDYATTGFLPYLKFDGVDDSLSTNSISFTSTDKMSVFAGVRKLSDAAIAVLYELSSNFGANDGTFCMFAPNPAAGNYAFRSRGTLTAAVNIASGVSAPVTNSVTGLADIAATSMTIRNNGVVIETTTLANQGTGNYGTYPLYIGRRGGSSLPFNGQLYSMIIVGKAVTAGELSSTETYVNQKTGAY